MSDEMYCPICKSTKFSIEKRPNGYSTCLECTYKALTLDIQQYNSDPVLKSHLGSSVKVKTTTIKETKSKFDFESLKKLLRVPDHAYDVKIYVDVPGGGDYSNMKLNIDEDVKLCVDYKTKE